MNEKEFISYWKNKLQTDVLKEFPQHFLDSSENETLILPGTTLTLGGEIFGSYEILDTRGNSIFIADNFPKAKYILYANKNKPAQVQIPLDKNDILNSVKNYEKYLDTLLKQIESDYKKRFPEAKNFASVSTEIFNLLNLKRY